MDKRRLLLFLRTHSLAVQSSLTPGGAPQAAIVGFAVTDGLEIVFDAVDTSRKVQNLRRNPKIALVIGGWNDGDERTAQYEGVADEPSGAELTRVKKAYFTCFPDGRERLKWPGITYVRVLPHWIRYSDYNQDPPEIVEFNSAQLARQFSG